MKNILFLTIVPVGKACHCMLDILYSVESAFCIKEEYIVVLNDLHADPNECIYPDS